MGLLEAALTLPIALAFLSFGKRSHPQGFFVAALCLYYAPIRFVLDFSRATDIAGADARYLRLTPAQWGCIGLLAVGTHALAGAVARSRLKGRAQHGIG
jgi:phosphatidylglycerol:prolipoprotein diacylglycerol transferase